MLTCTKSKKLITALAESGFKVVDAELFEHLKKCKGCAGELKGLKNLRTLLESAPRHSAPYWMTERVMRRICADSDLGEGRRPDSLRNLAAAFALLFALGAGILSGAFIASNVMDPARAAGARDTLLAYSADALDPATPDIVAVDYLTAAEDTNEK